MSRGAVVFSAVFVMLVAVIGPRAQALPCSDYSSLSPAPIFFFCDDFDRYCTPPPSGNDVCDPETATPDDTAFHAAWPADGTCDPESLMNFLVSGLDVKGSYGSQNVQRGHGWDEVTPYDRIYRHVNDLVSEIQDMPDNTTEADAVNGDGPIDQPLTAANTVPEGYVDSMDRDLRPLALRGTFHFHPLDGANQAAVANMVYYHELFLGEDRAPTDFTRKDCNFWHDCNCKYLHPENASCASGEQAKCDGGTHDGMNCTDDSMCYGGPLYPILDYTDGQVHASFAIGLMAIIDGADPAAAPTGIDPCDLDQGSYPSEWRMVVYDGKEWHTLRHIKFDIPLTYPADLADFFPLFGWNKIDFAIGAEYIEVRLTNVESMAYYSGTPACVFHECKGGLGGFCDTDGDCPPGNPGIIPNEYWVARVPRQYTGPFNKYAIGPGKGRNITDPENPGPFECIEPFSSDDIIADEIVLYDGVFEHSVPHGACCLPYDCQFLTEDDCTTAGGVWQGNRVMCEPGLCRWYPWADGDHDDDIDQADYAMFQICYGASDPIPTDCQIFNHNGDSQIDATDWGEFWKCWTGPNVPFSLDVAPTCDP